MAVAHQRRAKTTVLCTVKSARKQGFLKMILKGTKFQLKVWKFLKTIPKGRLKPINRWLLPLKALNQLVL